MNAVTLFCGCGGLDLGLAQAGFDIRVAVDSEPLCVESYRANFDQAQAICDRVEALKPRTLKALLEDAWGQVDLLAGGPPCPPYSKSRFYRKEKPRGIEDDLGARTLSGYLDVLRTLRPRAFLLENVAGFAYDVHRAALDWLIADAESLGYTCEWRVLNAADYGVPQIRERFFMVGMLGSRFEFPQPTHANPNATTLFDASLPNWRTAGEVLSDLDVDDDDAGHRAGGKHADLLRLVPPGDNYLYFTKERGHSEPIFQWRSRYWSFLLKLSPSLPSWTIQARRSNNMGPFHWRNRILRISEIKRLQGFPDGWHLEGNVDQQWRQVGNAVPPPLARVLGEALHQQIRRLNPTHVKETAEHERVLAGRRPRTRALAGHTG